MREINLKTWASDEERNKAIAKAEEKYLMQE
jgi:hypothetical protein